MTVNMKPDLDELLKQAVSAFNALPPVERAELMAAQAMSWARSCVQDPAPTVPPLTEAECFMVEAAMYYGFRHVDDDATVFQATESQIVALVKAAREQGRQDVAKGGLDLAVLRAANLARQAVWCPDQVPDLSFRGNELAGEAGEAMEAAFNTIAAMGALMVAIGRASNTIKKLERERQGWAGSRATLEQLAEELADVVICADLCGITAGIDLSPAVVAKFNATSEKVGLPTRLSLERGVVDDEEVGRDEILEAALHEHQHGAEG